MKVAEHIREKLYIDHVVLTVSDLERTIDFYFKIFGSADYKNNTSIMYVFGQTKLFFALPYNKHLVDDKFDSSRIGLEHIAIGILTLEDLKEISEILENYSIENSGIHIDKDSSQEKIWLNDPDGIRIEFYIRPK